MQLETLYWEKRGTVARVTLNRPEVLNAINNQVTIDLNTMADTLAEDPALRVVVITGEGRSFCTGIDLKQLSRDEIEMEFHHRFERSLRTLETMDKVVIAGINGWCLGGGLQLTLACDIRVAVASAQIGLPAIKESLIPGMAPFRLPRFVGMGRAKRLILSGDNIDAREAHAMGLVDHVFELEEFPRGLASIVDHYARVTSVGTRLSKQLTTDAFDREHAGFLEWYFEMQTRAQASEDHLEARRAYREGRDPVWR